MFRTLKADHKLKASGKQLFDASVYQTDSSTSSFHDMVRNMSELISTAKATEFHEMLADLSLRKRLMRLYTQNVDGIDVKLHDLSTNVPLQKKGPWPVSVQLHGGLEKMVCSKCNALSDFAPELFNGPEPPPCPVCIEADRVRTDHAGKRSHGIGRLRPRMVLYNEYNPDSEAIGAVVSADLRTRPDALIVVGTSMRIPGVRRIVREMCGVVRDRKDGLTVWINQDGPPLGKEFEDCWDLVVKGPCDEVARQWRLSFEEDKPCVNSDQTCTDAEIKEAKDRGDVQVIISPRKHHVQGMLTPASSPRPKPVENNQRASFFKLQSSSSTLKKNEASKSERTKAVKGAKPQNPKKTTASTKKANKKQPPKFQITSTFKVTKPVGRPRKDHKSPFFF